MRRRASSASRTEFGKPYARAREPEPPPGLAEFEQHVMAADAPAVVLIDRALIRAP